MESTCSKKRQPENKDWFKVTYLPNKEAIIDPCISKHKTTLIWLHGMTSSGLVSLLKIYKV